MYIVACFCNIAILKADILIICIIVLSALRSTGCDSEVVLLATKIKISALTFKFIHGLNDWYVGSLYLLILIIFICPSNCLAFIFMLISK